MLLTLATMLPTLATTKLAKMLPTLATTLPTLATSV